MPSWECGEEAKTDPELDLEQLDPIPEWLEQNDEETIPIPKDMEILHCPHGS